MADEAAAQIVAEEVGQSITWVIGSGGLIAFAPNDSPSQRPGEEPYFNSPVPEAVRVAEHLLGRKSGRRAIDSRSRYGLGSTRAWILAAVDRSHSGSSDDPHAFPDVYGGTVGRPGPILFTLDVDGERFAIREGGYGGTNYDWLSGPNKGYGFASSGTPNRPVEEHEESIRVFLAMIDPKTGYIGDD